MKTTVVRLVKKPPVKSTVLIEGLPGMGYVGKLAIEHLISELRAKKFAEIYSPHFPHHVSIESDGTIRPLRNEIYHVSVDGKDLMLWAGDVQSMSPEGHYEIVERVLDLAWEMKVKEMFTLGGYATGKYSEEWPKVLGLGDSELLKNAEKSGAFIESAGGPIIGAAGLLVGLGKLRGMKGACLLGETHGMVVDARAAKAVLDVLTGVLKIKIDMLNLEQRAKKTEQLMERLREEMERRKREERKSVEDETSYIG
jgi:hypothetical protein